MKVLKSILQFYINSSIHVGLSCFALVQITQKVFQISQQNEVGYFAFWGTVVGYNFVKYEELARAKKIKMRKQLRWITLFTFGAFIMVGYYFFKLERITQIVAVVFLGLTLLYTLPFFPNKKKRPKLGWSKDLHRSILLGWSDSIFTFVECRHGL